MPSPTLFSGLLAALALLLALPAALLLRRPGALALGGALLLALLATGSGVLAWRLHQGADLPAALPQNPAVAGEFTTIPAASLDQALAAAHGKPVLLEFYADWCSSCQVWKQQVFNRADVQAALRPLTLLRIDASDMTPATQQALNRFDLAGLPALISFNSQGQELKPLRLLGEMKAPDFISWVQTRLLPASKS